MKLKLLTLSLLALLTMNVNAAIDGIPLTDAEIAHIAGSAYITKLCDSLELDFWQSLGVVLTLGTLKELYDLRSTGFSVQDIGFNVSGVFLSYSVDEVVKVLARLEPRG